MNWKHSSCACAVGTVAGIVLGFAPAVGAGAAATATCAHLTKAQIQPLLVHRVTKLTVQPVSGVMYFSSAKQVGERCLFADTETSNALVVTVINGPAAARAYQSDVRGLGHSLARVSVVSGGKAVRQRADSHDAVATAEVASIKGSTYCGVVPQDDELPNVAKLEQAAGDTADIGDKAYAEIAAAIGTVCNRIYGSGSTNPAPALSVLEKIKPKHTGGDSGGLTVPAFPPKP